jgi:hypothetical protein
MRTLKENKTEERRLGERKRQEWLMGSLISDDGTAGTHLRLVEGWLPLAQDANQHYGWQLDGPRLEVLIIAAAPALAETRSVLAARAVLWQVYRRQVQEEL